MFCMCQCYFTQNYYSQILNRHLEYREKASFLLENKQILQHHTPSQIATITDEFEKELQRRKNLHHESQQRAAHIAEEYKPLHPQVYQLQEEHLSAEFLSIVNFCKSPARDVQALLGMVTAHKADCVFSFPVFTKKFCDDLLEELDHFQASGLPIGRPNTMNNYGVVFNELGFDRDLVSPLREKYLQPICMLLYPEWCNKDKPLDSHKAFTVQYSPNQDIDLNNHYDNAEVTLNICLGKEFDEGSLFFGKMRKDEQSESDLIEVCHKVTHGILHRGQQMHGAMAIEDGERVNLIIWMRSSGIRNTLCPMCDDVPQLEEVTGFGDGFTKTEGSVNVCSVT